MVVTFDRAALLAGTVRRIERQSRPPEQILVVDNGCRDATKEWLREHLAEAPWLEVLTLPENLGPAGGFAAGLGWAAERDFTHLWAMDDDVDVEEQCLELLLAAVEAGVSELLFPEVRNRAGSPTSYPGWSAVLLPADLVREAGVPNAELFWWIEDTEYLQWRLPRQFGAGSRTVAAARAVHGEQRPTQRPPWKDYYEVRNTLHYRLWVQRGRPLRRLRRAMIVVAAAFSRTLRGPQRFRRLGLVVLALAHGLSGRLGKRVDPAAA